MGSALHLLVVEDDPDLRQILTDVLVSRGYRVRAAANGREALTVLDQTPQQSFVVLLDLMMPVMDGLQFLGELRRRPGARHRVIAISANDQLRGALSDMEVVGRLSKPFDSKQLTRILDQLE